MGIQPRESQVIAGSQTLIKKVELVRFMIEALNSFDYKETAMCLERESGIHLHSQRVKLFMEQIIKGEWDESLSTLPSIESIDEKSVESASVAILQHKLSEACIEKNFVEVLNTLKNQIAPLCKNDKHLMARYLLNRSHSKESLGEIMPNLRNILPRQLIPERRLANLVDRALLDEKYTHIPSKTLQILKGHFDEVWFVQFSHNGKYLASSSRDYRVVIWEVNEATHEVSLMRVLRGHSKAVSYMSWSPDDTQLLTCGQNERVRRWNILSGELLREYFFWGTGTFSCTWTPKGDCILAGLADHTIVVWSLEGKEMHRLEEPQVSSWTSDLAIASNGVIITAFDLDSILLLGHGKRKLLEVEDGEVLTFCLSEDGDFLLVSLLHEEIQLWNIGLEEPVIVKTFEGHKRQKFIVRTCFGGKGQGFVASGSEDTQVYIWDKASGDIIRKLEGHSKTVTCVSWNPTNPSMLASASDDGTIRIWG
ncbi:hypothetical protein ABFS83_13G008600 [Erythranthe nasuta]